MPPNPRQGEAPSLPTPASYAAAVAQAARLALSSTGEGLPAYARRMAVSYSSLWRLLHGRDVRMRTLQALYERIVEQGPACRPPADLHFLGRITYVRARGFVAAPHLEVAEVPPVCALLGGPGSGKTATLAVLALGADPLGPAPRLAAAALGVPLAALAGTEVTVLGTAGRLCVGFTPRPGPDPLRIQVSARVRGADREAVVGSLSLPGVEVPSRVAYVGEGVRVPGFPESSQGLRALAAAGYRKQGALLGHSARRVAAAAHLLELQLERPGLVLIDEGIPEAALPPLLELAQRAAAAGAQVLFAGPWPPDAFLAAGAGVVNLRRSARGIVRGRLVAEQGLGRDPPGTNDAA